MQLWKRIIFFIEKNFIILNTFQDIFQDYF